MANEFIKEYAKKNHVKLWQIASSLGYKQDGTLSRKLRFEMDGDETRKILEIIDALSDKEEQEQNLELMRPKPLFCENCGITETQPLFMQKYCRYCGERIQREEKCEY